MVPNGRNWIIGSRSEPNTENSGGLDDGTFCSGLFPYGISDYIMVEHALCIVLGLYIYFNYNHLKGYWNHWLILLEVYIFMMCIPCNYEFLPSSGQGTMISGNLFILHSKYSQIHFENSLTSIWSPKNSVYLMCLQFCQYSCSFGHRFSVATFPRGNIWY